MSETLTVALTGDVQRRIKRALERAGDREVGGVLMAEHVSHNRFVVRDITIQDRGSIASFVRRIEDALRGLSLFFKAQNHDYQRFNYLGEWHSHPLFPAEPSSKDDHSMVEIVSDKSVGANFVVLVIVKLAEAEPFRATVHYYLPAGERRRGLIEFEQKL